VSNGVKVLEHVRINPVETYISANCKSFLLVWICFQDTGHQATDIRPQLMAEDILAWESENDLPEMCWGMQLIIYRGSRLDEIKELAGNLKL
jgi:hypothetical protein